MQKLPTLACMLCLLIFFQQNLRGSVTDPQKDSLIVCDSVCDTLFVCRFDTAQMNSVSQPGEKESFRRKKLITAILAFPIPFGFIGLHRIYLGSAPWIPVAYLCTGGGGFGLLPLMDFIFIVSADEKEFKEFENNGKLFMWAE
jgi:TM2 domain-containing membrane protein YozV